MTRTLIHTWHCVVALVVSLTLPPLVHAQQTTMPSSVLRASRESAIFASQLRLAMDQARVALAGFQAGGDSISIEQAVQSARNAYVLIRAARSGMILKKEASRFGRFGDPILDNTIQRTTEAWDLARIPVDAVTFGLTRQEYLSKAIPALIQALTILEFVLAGAP